MRPPIAAGAIAGFVVLSVLVYVAGHSLVEPSIIIDAEDMPADYALSDDAEGNEADLSHLDHTGATSDQSDAGNTTKLRSLRMAPLNDRFGVGGQGKPKVMGRGGYVALVLTFTDRAQDLVITSFFQRTRVATQ